MDLDVAPTQAQLDFLQKVYDDYAPGRVAATRGHTRGSAAAELDYLQRVGIINRETPRATGKQRAYISSLAHALDIPPSRVMDDTLTANGAARIIEQLRQALAPLPSVITPSIWARGLDMFAAMSTPGARVSRVVCSHDDGKRWHVTRVRAGLLATSPNYSLVPLEWIELASRAYSRCLLCGSTCEGVHPLCVDRSVYGGNPCHVESCRKLPNLVDTLRNID